MRVNCTLKAAVGVFALQEAGDAGRGHVIQTVATPLSVFLAVPVIIKSGAAATTIALISVAMPGWSGDNRC
jgi:hypothetical protein